jgi:hypothetical protein
MRTGFWSLNNPSISATITFVGNFCLVKKGWKWLKSGSLSNASGQKILADTAKPFWAMFNITISHIIKNAAELIQPRCLYAHMLALESAAPSESFSRRPQALYRLSLSRYGLWPP